MGSRHCEIKAEALKRANEGLDSQDRHSKYKPKVLLMHNMDTIRVPALGVSVPAISKNDKNPGWEVLTPFT